MYYCLCIGNIRLLLEEFFASSVIIFMSLEWIRWVLSGKWMEMRLILFYFGFKFSGRLFTFFYLFGMYFGISI